MIPIAWSNVNPLYQLSSGLILSTRFSPVIPLAGIKVMVSSEKPVDTSSFRTPPTISSNWARL